MEDSPSQTHRKYKLLKNKQLLAVNSRLISDPNLITKPLYSATSNPSKKLFFV